MAYIMCLAEYKTVIAFLSTVGSTSAAFNARLGNKVEKSNYETLRYSTRGSIVF